MVAHWTHNPKVAGSSPACASYSNQGGEAIGKFGDCEDYALAKRNALLNAGWPKDKLGLCVCYTQSGEGHCCLWVDTDKGSFILDNNYAFPMKPSELPYKWESMLCNGEWVQLNGFA